MKNLRHLFFQIIILLASQTTIAQWTSIGPNGGKVTAILSVYDTIYAGGTNSIFQSIDNGLTWKRQVNGLPERFTVKKFLSDGNTVFMGTDNEDLGIFTYSADEEKWVSVSGVADDFMDFLIKEEDGEKVLYATSTYEVFRTINRGQSWTSLPYIDHYTTALGKLKGVLIASTDSGNYTYSPANESWTFIPGTINDLDFFQTMIDNGDTLYAQNQDGIYYTTPGFKSWTNITYNINNCITSLLLKNGTLYAGLCNDGVSSIKKLDPLRKTWSSLDSGLTISGFVTGLSANSKSIFLSNQSGIFRRNDGQKYWEDINVGITNGEISKIKKIGKYLHAGSFGNAYVLADGEKDWKTNNKGLDSGSFVRGFYNFENVDYLYTSDAVLLKSISDSMWNYFNDGFNGFVSPYDFTSRGDTIYVGTGDGIYCKAYGSIWQHLNTGLDPDYDQIASIAAGASDFVYGIIQNSAIYRFKNELDGSFSYKDITKGLPDNTKLNALLCLGDTVFVGTSEGIYFSANYGTSWVLSNKGLNRAPIQTMVNTKSGLYAAGPSGKIFRSVDLGISWVEIAQGSLGTLYISNLAADSIYLYAATEGGAVWKFHTGKFYPPKVTTGSASSITATSAVLKGEVLSPGFPFEVYLQYSIYPNFSTSESIKIGTYAIDKGAKEIDVSLSQLQENTKYYYRIYAKNLGSEFQYGKDSSFKTGYFTVIDKIIAPTELKADPLNSYKLIQPDTNTISLFLNQNLIGTEVKFFSRNFTNASWNETSLSSVSKQFKVTLSATQFDEIGFEYFFIIKSPDGYSKKEGKDTSIIRRIAISFPQGISFPGKLRTGERTRDYNLISLPLELQDKRPESIFYTPAGADRPDDTKFRFLTYVGEKGNYKNIWKANPEIITPGIGYWFAARNLLSTVNSGPGSTVINNPAFKEDAFILKLRPGYNQIGNPFLRKLLWSDIFRSTGETLLGPKMYGFISQGDTAVLKEMTTLDPFSGAYILNLKKDSILLKLPIIRKGTAGNMRVSKTENSLPLSVKIKLESNCMRTEINAIGLHSSAKVGVDIFDQAIPPLPGEFPMLLFSEKEWMVSEILPDSGEGNIWNMKVTGVPSEMLATMSWNIQEIVAENQIWLYDLTKDVIINMRLSHSYSFNGMPKFRIFYGTEDYIKKHIFFDNNQVNIYPMPIQDKATISFTLPESKQVYSVKISILDITGKLLYTIKESSYTSGFYSEELVNTQNFKGVNLLEFAITGDSHQSRKVYTKLIFN